MTHRFFLLALAALLAAPVALAQDHGERSGDGMHDGDHDGMHYVVHGRANDEARVSPNALTGQTIGTTNVVVAYGRPSVNGRTVFGDLVPYGQVWRTGANEATAVHLSEDLHVEGERLPAGTYALFTIPQDDGAWTVVFNRAAEQWGAFNHDPSQDALRVEVTPEMGESVEQMSFWFEDVDDDSATMVLAWADVMLPIQLEVAD
ncbi:MAG: DUF2911 domain-containing protein [Rubricoccaceae bacterium]|nr:DUF2911 domain-containing protein [Rubricoccaceae bacterium]